MWGVIIGAFIIVLGFLMVYKPRFFVDFLGHQPWVEKIFSVYDDELAYKIIGIIIIFVGVMVMTNLIWGILGFLLSPVLNAGRN